MISKALKSPIFLLVTGGVLFFLIAGGFWWAKVYQDPYNVYWGMLRNNFSTSAVTKHLTETSSGTQLDQYSTSVYGSQNTVHVLTTLKTAKSTVKTETIGTTASDSVRYTQVQTSQKNKLGKPFDFSSILGKWASSQVKNSSDASAAAGQFMQTTLGLMGGNLFPQANVSTADRQDLLKRLHDEVVFDTSYSDVKKTKQNGRPIYTYAVNIEPVAYVGFEKVFAQDIGLKSLNTLDPNSYQGESAIKVNISVDAWSHQLVAIDYPGQNHHETYAGYGVASQVSAPKATISGSELQSFINNIQ